MSIVYFENSIPKIKELLPPLQTAWPPRSATSIDAALNFISFLTYQTLDPTFHSVGISFTVHSMQFNCRSRSATFILPMKILCIYSAYYFGCMQKHILEPLQFRTFKTLLEQLVSIIRILVQFVGFASVDIHLIFMDDFVKEYGAACDQKL